MTTERMLEFLILRDILQKGVGREYKENKMWDRYYVLRTDFLKPYHV